MIKKLTKKVIPILLALIMIFSVPLQAFAESTDGSTEKTIEDYETFVVAVDFLEQLAYAYAQENPGLDPLDLVIKYIRTGVDRYNDGSWNIMAGYENKEFAEYVIACENMFAEQGFELNVTGLKNIKNFYLPNGEKADLGHVFGTMDITYNNGGSENHADVGGWAGDLVDLLDIADEKGVSGTVEEMTKEISENYLGRDFSPSPGFSAVDIAGDIDAYYIMQSLYNTEYDFSVLAGIMMEYFTEDLSPKTRAEYFLKNRLGTTGTRNIIRNEVYNAYVGNKVVTTLEATRTLESDDVISLRKACCYAFADYLCELAGDYVESNTNEYYKVFDSQTSILAPGITQEIVYATSADNKQMKYFIATSDITREDVNVYANYGENDPSSWKLTRVLDQAKFAQEKYGNEDSEHYIENYNVVASINGAGYNMKTGEPGGLLVMGGKEYHPINSNGFFGILDDGTAIIASTDDYNNIYKGRVKEGVAGFGDTLIKDGKIVVSKTENYYDSRATRTAVGITKTGKVVFMVLDGRQEPVSCGGSMIEIAQIMLDAGCVNAVNLDGGGSSTFVSKQPGDEELSVINVPSDGYARSVSASLMAVSTAPSSTKFDHAVLESDYSYMTVGSTVKLTPVGVSATGNKTDLPENITWEVVNDKWGTITEEGVLTALRVGSIEVNLLSDGDIIGTKIIESVVPDNLYFNKTLMDVVYGEKIALPLVLLYENKKVAFNADDVVFELSKEEAGKMEGTSFVGNADSGIKVLLITASLKADSEKKAEITLNLRNQGEMSFDFEQATGGDRQLAWDRKVSNSTTLDNVNYIAVSTDEDMVTSYIVAMDMTTIPIPSVLSDLIYMLPGADVEGANAWMFLCQLAERVSPLTEVTAKLKFDMNFDVDYSELDIINEYFTLNKVTFDEATNELSITLNWIDCTQAIDQATANPLCMVRGIKLTPKEDADWGSKNTIKVENTGDISYKVYLRASSLYTFACDEEHQKTYSLYPYKHPENSADAGAWFGHTYKEFYDTYNLMNALKNGWQTEDGGFAYYVDGEKLTGVNKVDGYYYDFGKDGINNGQTKYTGVFYDESANAYYYSKVGELDNGWQTIGGEWYHFNTSTNKATTGRVKMYGVYYNFEENGKLTSGVWGKTIKGTRYYYGPSYYVKGWFNINGIDYYFKEGYRCEGIDYHKASAMPTTWYDFGPDGSTATKLNGVYEIEGEYRYFEEGIGTEKHLIKVGNDYYYTIYNGVVVTNKTINTASTNCDLPKGTYTFGADGKMLGSSPDGEIVEIDGELYYYENGKGVEKYLVKVDGDYYFAQYKGKIVRDKNINAFATNCDLGHSL